MTRMTNVEFITKMMEYSQYGVLAQCFVIEALSKWSAQVAKASPEEISKASNGFISGEAWVGVAKEIHDKIAKQYNYRD